MTVLDLLLGRTLGSDEARGEQIGSLVGIPVFGTEVGLTLPIPLGAAGIALGAATPRTQAPGPHPTRPARRPPPGSRRIQLAI